jgi:outer membrane protein TolC
VAWKNKLAATAYFNFLLNRPLNDSVKREPPDVMPFPEGVSEDFTKQAVQNREEIRTLEKYRDITDLTIQMNRASAMPDLFVLADYGFQGEKYRFNKNQDYMQASVVLSWDLLSGFQNRSRIRQALIQREMFDRRLDEAKSQVELQVLTAFNTLQASQAAVVAAESQAKSAREGFRLVSRKYEEGQSNLIEFLDARTSLTQAEENLIISKYAYLSDMADFEKAASRKTNP